MLYILVAEPATVLADSEPDSMAAGTVIGPRVLGIEGLDRIATFYADWHRIWSSLMRVVRASRDEHLECGELLRLQILRWHGKTRSEARALPHFDDFTSGLKLAFQLLSRTHSYLTLWQTILSYPGYTAR